MTVPKQLCVVLNDKSRADLAVVRHYAETVLHLDGSLSDSQVGRIALALAARYLHQTIKETDYDGTDT